MVIIWWHCKQDNKRRRCYIYKNIYWEGCSRGTPFTEDITRKNFIIICSFLHILWMLNEILLHFFMQHALIWRKWRIRGRESVRVKHRWNCQIGDISGFLMLVMPKGSLYIWWCIFCIWLIYHGWIRDAQIHYQHHRIRLAWCRLYFIWEQ